MPTYDANILPTTTGIDLGASGQRFDAYLQDLYVSGSSTFANMNGIIVVDGTTYAATSAGIQAAIDALPSTGGIVYLPAGTYSLTTGITLDTGCWLKGAGTEATILSWASTSGTMITALSETRVRCSDFRISSSVAGVSSIGISYSNCTDSSMFNIFSTGGSSSLGFYNPFRVTGIGSGAAQVSVGIKCVNLRTDYHRGVAFLVDNTVDLTINGPSYFYSVANNTSFDGLIIDSGVSGAQLDVWIGGGRNGFVVRHTDPGTYSSIAPRFLFGHVVSDTTTGGDAIVFDSTLATNALLSDLELWAAWAGRTTAGAVTTAASDGIRVSGGTAMDLRGISRGNTGNGVLVNSADVSRVRFARFKVLANNQDNNADQHGFYITTASTNIAIVDSTIGNVVDSGGRQKYAIKVAAVNADQLQILDCDLNTNDTGALSNGNTGSSWVWGNLPSSSATANIVHGDILLASPASLYPSIAGVDLGTTTLRWDAFFRDVDLSQLITKYNNIATVSNGVPSLYAQVNLTAQTTAVSTTTLYAVPAAGAGQYRLCWNAKITTAATTGAATSTLGALTIVYTDPDNVSVTLTSAAIIAAGSVATTSTANTTGTALIGVPQLLNCKASTNITYAFAYASNTANEMAYNLHITLERV